MSITVAALMTKMGYDDNDLARGLDGSQSKISGFAGIAKAGLLTAGAAVAAGLAAVGASVVTMQDAFTPLMTMTGKNTEQFKQLTAGIKEVIKSSPHSAAEIGSAAYEILGAGITDAAAAQATLVAANKLSLAGLGPIGDSVNLITSAMNAWRQENITGDQAAKILFGTISVGKGTIADFSRGFGEVAPLASNLGVSFKELMAATATLTTTGLPASQAYSGLKAAFSNILNPTKEAAGVAESLGITMGAAGLKAKGLAGFIADVAERSGGSTDALVSLFGSMDAVNAIMGLSGPNAEAFAKSFETIDAAGQNLDQTAKDVSETFSNRFKIMKNNVLVYLSEIGEKGLDWLADKQAEWWPKIVAGFQSFKSELDGIGTPDGGFFARLGDAVGKGKIAVTGAIDEIKAAFVDFMQGWQGHQVGEFAEGPAGFFENLGKRAKDVNDVLKSVWTDIGAGFEELSAVINGDGGRAKKEGYLGQVDSLGLAIRDTIPSMITVFDGLSAAIKNVRTTVDENWPAIGETIGGTLEAISGFIQVNLWLTRSAVDGMATAWRILSEEVIPGVALALSILDTIGRGTWAVLRLLGRVVTEELWPVLKTLARVINEEVLPALDLIGRVVAAVAMPILRTFGRLVMEEVWPGLRLLGRVITEEVIPGFMLLVRGVQAAISGVITAVNWLRPLLGISLWDIGSWLWNAGVNLIEGLIGGINSMAGRAAQAARGVVQGAINSAWKALVPGSPSRVGRAMGRNLGEGLIAGMQDREALVASTAANMANAMVTASQYNYSIGGPGNVQVNMPQGSNGNDVVRALRDWQKINGRIPVAVTGRNA